MTGPVDELTTGGTQRLVVRVEGDRDGLWATNLFGASPAVGLPDDYARIARVHCAA